MKQLSSGQQIRVRKANGKIVAPYSEVIVHTLLECKRARNQEMTWDEAVAEEQEKAERFKSKGYNWVPAWAAQSPHVLVADYPGKADDVAKRNEARANAVIIDDGEHVLIDGIEFVTKVLGDYSEVAHFVFTA